MELPVALPTDQELEAPLAPQALQGCRGGTHDAQSFGKWMASQALGQVTQASLAPFALRVLDQDLNRLASKETTQTAGAKSQLQEEANVLNVHQTVR